MVRKGPLEKTAWLNNFKLTLPPTYYLPRRLCTSIRLIRNEPGEKAPLVLPNLDSAMFVDPPRSQHRPWPAIQLNEAVCGLTEVFPSSSKAILILMCDIQVLLRLRVPDSPRFIGGQHRSQARVSSCAGTVFLSRKKPSLKQDVQARRYLCTPQLWSCTVSNSSRQAMLRA